MDQYLKFECSHCGGKLLEEICKEVTQATVINDIIAVAGDDSGADVDYGEMSTQGGEVDRYQCARCGRTLTLYGRAVNDPFILAQYLIEKGHLRSCDE